MMNTTLTDRIVWYDGSISIDPSYIDKFITYDRVFVTSLNDEITQYNNLVPLKDRLIVKESNDDIDIQWNIPDDYIHINVVRYIEDALCRDIEDNFEINVHASYTDNDIKIRVDRICMELNLFKQHGLIPLVRTLIYIINTFEKENVVWGPGRGSSVSSYILYLIKVHDVDSVLYDLDITDFIKL